MTLVLLYCVLKHSTCKAIAVSVHKSSAENPPYRIVAYSCRALYFFSVIRPFLIGTVKYEFLVFRFQKLVWCPPYAIPYSRYGKIRVFKNEKTLSRF